MDKKKLLIVTVVSYYEEQVLKLFKEVNIESFSGSRIKGYRDVPTIVANSSWFPSQKGGANSIMFFSFTDDDKIDLFFSLVEKFNKDLKTNNPIHAIVAPIERSI